MDEKAVNKKNETSKSFQFFDENKEVHENLTQLRKKYDEVKGMTLKKEQDIQKIRVKNILFLTFFRTKQKIQNLWKNW